MITKYEWNDQLHSRNKQPRLWIIKEGKAVKFDGKDIDNVVCILTEKFTPQGKWSFTVYRLALVHGARAIELCAPTHGGWGDDFESWDDAARRTGVSVDETRKMVFEEYPKLGERLDKIEAFYSGRRRERLQIDRCEEKKGRPLGN